MAGGNLCCRDVAMPEEVLDLPDVNPGIQEQSRGRGPPFQIEILSTIFRVIFFCRRS